MKMKEYMESELSGIFRVKQVAKNTVFGSPGTHFMHMRVNSLVGHTKLRKIRKLKPFN